MVNKTPLKLSKAVLLTDDKPDQNSPELQI